MARNGPDDMNSEQTAPRRKTGEFTGWHMLAVVFLFFGTIITVNGFLAFSAFTSWTGLVVQNSYVASQEFNEKLAASRAQAALNLDVQLTYRNGELIFTLRDAQQQPVRLEDVSIALTRPIGITQDRTLNLEPQGDSYAVAEDLPSGAWNVVIHAVMPGHPDFNYRARLIVDVKPLPGS